MAGAEGHVAVVIGAGPAGLYLTEKLAEAGAQAILLNRDIKPGGLAEYGIFVTKYKMKDGLRRQFKDILSQDGVTYLGHVVVGEGRDVSLAEIRSLHPSVIVVTAGAQGTKYTGTPGEKRPGVYHAKDIVYHYNHLPPFSERPYPVADEALIVGIGNVAIDIAHWLTRLKKIKGVTIMARRGPAERKYSLKEIWHIATNVDRADLDREFERIRPKLVEAGQDPDAIKREMIEEFEKSPEPKVSDTVVRFRFLMSPVEFLGSGENGPVERVKVERNKLVAVPGGEPKAKGEKAFDEIPFGTVVFAVGDRVDEGIGLPYEDGSYVTNKVADPSGVHDYQVADPGTGQVQDGIFVAGWSRKASDGLVGVAKKDGQTCAEHVLAYLAGKPAEAGARERVRDGLLKLLAGRKVAVAGNAEIAALEREEKRIAAERKLPEFKFDFDREMLDVLRRTPPAACACECEKNGVPGAAAAKPAEKATRAGGKR